MSRLGDIIRDGFEHVRRTFHRATLRHRLQTENIRRGKLLRRLGCKAWELRIDLVNSSPAGKEMSTLYGKIETISSDYRGESEFLDVELKTLGSDAFVEDDKWRKLDAGLRLLSRQESSLSKEVRRLESALDESTAKRDRLKKDLVFARKGVLASGAGDEVGESTPDESAKTSALVSSLEFDLESVRGKTKSLRSRLATKRKALEETALRVSTGKKPLEEASASVKDYRVRLSDLEEKLRFTRESAEKNLEELQAGVTALETRLAEEFLEHRSDHPELAPLVTAIDLANSKTESLENEIRSEDILLELINEQDIFVFYSLSFASLFLLLVLLAPFAAWLLSLM